MPEENLFIWTPKVPIKKRSNRTIYYYLDSKKRFSYSATAFSRTTTSLSIGNKQSRSKVYRSNDVLLFSYPFWCFFSEYYFWIYSSLLNSWVFKTIDSFSTFSFFRVYCCSWNCFFCNLNWSTPSYFSYYW